MSGTAIRFNFCQLRLLTLAAAAAFIVPTVVAAQSGTTQRPRSADPYFSSAAKSEKMPVVRQGTQLHIQDRRVSNVKEQIKANPNAEISDEVLEKYQVTGYHDLKGSTGTAFEEGHVLAVVGGEPIFVGDVMFDANQILQKHMVGAPAEVVDEQRRKLIKRLLPKFIDEKLLLLHVKQGLPEGADFADIVSQAAKEFDEKAMESMMEQSGAKSVVEFDAQLRAQGSSLRQMRQKWSEEQLVRYFILRGIQSDTTVTHHELLDYYREHIADFESASRTKWEQVMIRFGRMDSREAARQAIVELGNKIVYGASFSEVAKKSSHGFMASEGGAHDWTSKGSLVLKEIDKAIFELPVGELSDVIETAQGFHIVRVVEREEAGVTDFRDAQIEIKKKLEQEKRAAAFEKQIAKLRSEVTVEIFELPSASRQARQPSPNSGSDEIGRILR